MFHPLVNTHHTHTHTQLHQCSVSLVFISQRTPSGLTSRVQHGRVRTPFFPGTGGVPPLFREREPPSVPTSAKRGSPKISAFPEKGGNGPKVGLVPGTTKPPTPQKCPFPLRVPTSVPGLLRPRFCSPFWFPLLFLVSLGAVCSGFRSQRENLGAPRGGYRKKPLFSQ